MATTATTKYVSSTSKNVFLDYGMVIQINGHDVAISPKSITGALEDAKLTGKVFELTSRVELGTISDIGELMLKIFGLQVDITEELKRLPAPLDAVAGKIAQLNLAIEDFYVRIPPTHEMVAGVKQEIAADKREEVSFVIGFSAFWGIGDKIELVKNMLTISGAYFKVYQNMGPAAVTVPKSRTT